MKRLALVTTILGLAVVLGYGCAKTPATAVLPSAPSPTSDGRMSGGSADRGVDPVAARPFQTAPSAMTQTGGGQGAGNAGGTPGRFDPQGFAVDANVRDVYFDFDRYDVRPADMKILDANAEYLKSKPGLLVIIEGHTDERGTNEYNMALGERRARATMTYLASRGIAATRMSLVSYGEERPGCAEHGESCWAKNRRAHFLVKAQ